MLTLEELNSMITPDLVNNPKGSVGRGFPDSFALVQKLESQFEEGMTWENFGTFWKVGKDDEELPVNYHNVKPIKV